MSPKRVMRRISALLIWLAALAITSGCRHSPYQRLFDGSQEVSSRPEALRAVASLPPLPSISLPIDPGPTRGSHPDPGFSRLAAEDASLPQTPLILPEPSITASATPLLDRALRRAEALERARVADSTPSAASSRTQPTGEGPHPFPGSVFHDPPRTVAASSLPAKPMPVLPTGRTGEKGTSKVVGKAVASVPPPPPAPSLKEIVGPPDLRSSAPIPADAPASGNLARLAAEDSIPFAVGELRLCREIRGFGAFVPIESGPLHAGQSVLVYAELTGLRYQTREKTNVSRISVRAVLDARDGTRIWEQSLGEAEDACLSRRRDNFLGCRLTLPRSLPPGDYRLRLTQTDLVARQSAAAELPVTIVR